MKLLTLPAVCLLSLPVFADYKVELVQVTATAKLADDIPMDVKPFGGFEPTSMVFLISGENLVALDEETAQIESDVKWEVGFSNSVSEDGKYARLSLKSKEVLLGKADKITWKGTIEALTGSKTEIKTLSLARGAKGEAGAFQVAFQKAKKGFGFNAPSIKLTKGDIDTVKAIEVKADGKVVESMSSSSSSSQKTFYFEELKAAEVEVSLTLWTDLKREKITFKK